MCKKVVFDLDDTLYKEINFVKSGFKEIAKVIGTENSIKKNEIFNFLIENYFRRENAIRNLIIHYNLSNSLESILSIYRTHHPNIKLDKQTKNVLNTLKNRGWLGGILTDGRSIQQRNKIKSLGLYDYFDEFIISEEIGTEKPSLDNFLYFVSKYKKDCKLYYVGDNTNKDFISAKKLGWITICLLDNGQNIHKQDFKLESVFLPDYTINDIKETLQITNE